ncbi:kinase-like protein [Aspergillus neoniger CBS 115656]|uniref:Kinase-like protein n=1 Tax=Aspergillus neoniger (strain CBS 115656) TaxID=1448310 RepID=A0A318YQQ6_ASPNB|nr:kinase-like protein [Aspergillus neoniger CBS 115656]PYH37021.1 kinase-like protein [Aspergillus neoniger CBS 115656]
MIADVSERSVESKILQHLQRGDLNHPGRKYISSLLDQFSFKGPNGHHMCLVSEVAGCSVAESKENSPRFMFSLDIARAIAAQVTMGLAYMHSLGVGHGDLHARNILLLQPVDFEALSIEDIYEQFGKPFEVPITRIDKAPIQSCAPAHAIIPMNLIVPSDQVVNCRVKITDFGSSFFFGKEPLELHTPTALLPPEAFFQDPITPAADIWTLGCTLYDILGERPLFETWADDPDDVIGEMVSTLGKLPKKWWQRWEKRPEFFLENGSWNPNFNRIQTPEFRPLDQRLWQMGRGETLRICELQEMEMASFKRLLEGMLAYEPLERVSAREAMESDFMLKWARPALLRLEG